MLGASEQFLVGCKMRHINGVYILYFTYSIFTSLENRIFRELQEIFMHGCRDLRLYAYDCADSNKETILTRYTPDKLLLYQKGILK